MKSTQIGPYVRTLRTRSRYLSKTGMRTVSVHNVFYSPTRSRLFLPVLLKIFTRSHRNRVIDVFVDCRLIIICKWKIFKKTTITIRRQFSARHACINWSSTIGYLTKKSFFFRIAAKTPGVQFFIRVSFVRFYVILFNIVRYYRFFPVVLRIF